MTIEIKVPVLPESVTDATVAKWYKKVGDMVERDERLLDLETDKVTLEVPAPQSGVIEKCLVKKGETVMAHQLLLTLGKKTDDTFKSTKKEPSRQAASSPEDLSSTSSKTVKKTMNQGPSARRRAAVETTDIHLASDSAESDQVTKLGLDHYLKSKSHVPLSDIIKDHEIEKRVPMSRLRQRVAERLVEAKQQMAMLTTFNEINMQPVMALRKRYQPLFQEKHQVKLGFMSFFVKASVEALGRFPAINASIDGTDLIYHRFFDIGIAIGSPRGLLVPILRHADSMSMADIEKQIINYAERAKTGKLDIEEISGGTFTITNGGTFGSMLSTPIVNPPQSAILGLHAITERPVAEDGQIVIRSVMYVALSYDHRIIDGRESVLFLKTIKELIEEPSRLLLEV